MAMQYEVAERKVVQIPAVAGAAALWLADPLWAASPAWTAAGQIAGQSLIKTVVGNPAGGGPSAERARWDRLAPAQAVPCTEHRSRGTLTAVPLYCLG